MFENKKVYKNTAQLYEERVTRIGRKLAHSPDLDDESIEAPKSILNLSQPNNVGNGANKSYAKGASKISFGDVGYKPGLKEPNLITSLCPDNLHAIAIDVDVPVSVVPSSQEGHYHLYIDKKITWKNYVRLLELLTELGIIEPGYTNAAKSHGFTTLRLPGSWKSPSQRPELELLEPEILLKLLDQIDQVYTANEILCAQNKTIVAKYQDIQSVNLHLAQQLATLYAKFNKVANLCNTMQKISTDINIKANNISKNVQSIETKVVHQAPENTSVKYDLTWS